jgi:phosphatidate cytidylyltransferase
MGKGALVNRIVYGLLFLVVVIGALLHPVALLVLCAFLGVTLALEFYRLTCTRRYWKEEALVIVTLVLMTVLYFFTLYAALPARWMLLGLVPVMDAWICQLFDGADGHDFVTAPYFPLVYVLPMLLSLLRLGFPCGVFSWKLNLGIFVLVWCCDIGAYCFGMLFGQRPNSRKLFPALSPKKSWIGVVGGTLFTFLAAWAVWALWGAEVMALFHWMMLAVIVSTLGVVGDLYESLVKRHAGVKDAGRLIPGHGGVLDRFDDALFVFPIAAIYLVLLQLI